MFLPTTGRRVNANVWTDLGTEAHAPSGRPAHAHPGGDLRPREALLTERRAPAHRAPSGGAHCPLCQENSGWGYDRIVGALANLGHPVSDQTVGNILRRYGIAPAPKRSQKTTWKDFIAAQMAVLAGTDFFTVEVLTWRGLAT